MRIRVAPSILAADFTRLAEEIKLVEEAGADMLHLDVMDAHFVPNLTFGPMVISAVSRLTNLPRDTHLMITDPEKYLDSFIEAGATTISFHLEVFDDQERERVVTILDRLEKAGVGTGIAISPDSRIDVVYPYLDRLERVLVMTVYPGFGGQELMPECLGKVNILKEEILSRGLDTTIGVDGGINRGNASEVIAAGTDVLVAGSAIFKADDPAAMIEYLHNAGGTT